MQSERLAKEDSTISAFGKHLHGRPVCTQLNKVREGQRFTARIISPRKCHEWQIVHHERSGTLQEQHHKWPILQA